MVFEYLGRKVFDGKTIEGFYQKINGKPFITPFNTLVAKEVDAKSVRCFTGKSDRNGKKIYEWAAMRFILDDPKDEELGEDLYVVIWDERNCGFYVLYPGLPESEPETLDDFFCEHAEIVGDSLEMAVMANSQTLHKVIDARNVGLLFQTEDQGEGDAHGSEMV